MKTVCKTSLSPKKRKGLHTRKTNIQENNLITKQTFHQTAFSMKTFYKTSPSPKNILHENGLQNKPFTKEHSPRKWSTKQTVHQEKGSTKQSVHQKNISKKTVYKTNLPPKKLKKTVYKKGIGHKCSPRKRSTQGPWPQKMRKIKPY